MQEFFSELKNFFENSLKISVDNPETRCYNNRAPEKREYMRMCWNRQTGTFEGRVSTDVWVQVPLLAPNTFLFNK